MLYALQGALLNVHWNDLAPDMKLQLVADAEQGFSNDAPQQAFA
jgi:DNA transformation protein